MKKILLSHLTILLLSTTSIVAQNTVRCSSEDYKQQQLALNPGLQAAYDANNQFADQFAQNHPNGYQSRSVVVIPVVFHVVYGTNPQNIPDSRLLAQIDVLNHDYRRTNTDANLVPSQWQAIAADCEIEFCLAKHDPSGNWTDGIERTSSTTTSWTTDDHVKSTSTGGANVWDHSKYLNIWVCNLSGGVLGYATLPGGNASVDGVVLAYQYVGVAGTLAPYNLGRTATHEIGHWLNMTHIWGDDFGTCILSDNVSDTPNQAGENYGCPTFPHIDACTGTSPGVMFMNYMDYVDDACMYMFTSGQKTRMWATLNGSRLSIQTSDACLVTGIATSTLQNVFGISPSPTEGNFKITFGNGSPQHFDIAIYSMLGEQIFNQHYDALNESELFLDLEGNPSGIYMIEIRSATGIATRKIVLEN